MTKNFECIFFISSVRSSLLSCPSCRPACSDSLVASFTNLLESAAIGTILNLSNRSYGAVYYNWYVNSVLVATTRDASYSIPSEGDFIISLLVIGADSNCVRSFSDTVIGYCPVMTDYFPGDTVIDVGQSVNFSYSGIDARNWYINGSFVSSAASFNQTFSTVGSYLIRIDVNNGICTKSIYSYVYVRDSCNGILFQRCFGGAGDDAGTMVIESKFGGYYVAGYTTSRGAGMKDALLMKLNDGGDIVWSRIIGGANDDEFIDMRELADGSIICGGNTKSFTSRTQDFLLCKFSSSGGLLWSKSYGTGTSGGDVFFGLDVIESTGDIALAGRLNWASDALVIKVNSLGNTIWAKGLNISATDFMYNVLCKGDTIIAVGGQSTSTIHDGTITAFDAAGNIISALRIDESSQNQGILSATLNGNHLVVHLPGSPTATGFLFNTVMEVDLNGTVYWQSTHSKYVYAGGSLRGYDQVKTNDGGVLFTAEDFSGNRQMHVYKLDRLGNFQLAYDFGGMNEERSWAVAETHDNNMLVAGYTSSFGSGGTDIYLVKAAYSNSLSASCVGDSTPHYTHAYTTNIVPIVWGVTNYTMGNAISPLVDTNRLINNAICVDTTCTVQEICGNGTDDDGDGWGDCEDPDCNCCMDTLWISGDSLLCPGGIIQLAVHGRYTQVEWQNGNTDSIITVSEPGVYYVSTTDSCGHFLSDTFRIYTDSLVIEGLSSDTLICNGDSVSFNLPFNSLYTYTWRENYNISCLTCPNPTTYPTTDTFYTVTIENPNGCVTVATSYVYVRDTNKLISLRSDTLICKGDTLTLDAGRNDVSWSTTETGQYIEVYNSGQYWAVVNGECHSSGDTMILNVDTLAINLPSDTVLCKFDSIIIDAGRADVRWSTGNIGQTIMVNSAGQYWVINDLGCFSLADTFNVNIDTSNVDLQGDTILCEGELIVISAGQNVIWSNGDTSHQLQISSPGEYWAVTLSECASDTINVTYELLNLSLSNDTTICDGEILILWATAADGVRYLWLTDSSTSSTLIVNQSGSYTVRVSKDGCVNDETVNVIFEDCSSQPQCVFVYADAFTPNGDGTNDVFGLQYSNCDIANYSLTIFNRWGEIIYEGRNISSGWDGKFKREPQPIGTYVYLASITFADGSSRQIQGNITLIR